MIRNQDISNLYDIISFKITFFGKNFNSPIKRRNITDPKSDTKGD